MDGNTPGRGLVYFAGILMIVSSALLALSSILIFISSPYPGLEGIESLLVIVTAIVSLFGIFVGIMGVIYCNNPDKGYLLTTIGMLYAIFAMPINLYLTLPQVVGQNFFIRVLLAILMFSFFLIVLAAPIMYTVGAAKNSKSGKQLLLVSGIAIFITSAITSLIFFVTVADVRNLFDISTHGAVVIMRWFWIDDFWIEIDTAVIMRWFWIVVMMARTAAFGYGIYVGVAGIIGRKSVEKSVYLMKLGIIYIIAELVILFAFAQVSQFLGGLRMGGIFFFLMLPNYIVSAFYIFGAAKNSNMVFSVSRIIESYNKCTDCGESYDAEMKSCPHCGDTKKSKVTNFV